MGKYFGTDGIRGVANSGLDSKLAFNAGRAAAVVLAKEKADGKPLFAIGKDTRLSCDMLEAAMVAGLCSAGADVLLLGVVPTPAVAYITKENAIDAGIVISASHNPFQDNGIKLFSSRGFKLSDEIEEKIEELIDNEMDAAQYTGADIGTATRRSGEYVSRYLNHIVSCADFGQRRLKVLIDCANGAASRTAQELFERLPIDVDIIKDHPNGTNINVECGSTHPEYLAKLVVAGGFDVGVAFDGDADRCMVVDENGDIVDGDKMMGICALSMREQGKLKGDAIVATVMSNMGFHEFARKSGIKLECTTVGDRYVLECMLEKGYNLGGEQSGHIIFLDDSTTGDGQLCAVHFLSVLSKSDKKVSELASDIPTYPQVLLNVVIENNDVKRAIMEDEEVLAAVEAEEKIIGDDGRILVRASGTEALIRVMVEAKEDRIANDTAAKLSDLIKKRANEVKA